MSFLNLLRLLIDGFFFFFLALFFMMVALIKADAADRPDTKRLFRSFGASEES